MILTISFWLYIIKLGVEITPGKKTMGTFFLKGAGKQYPRLRMESSLEVYLLLGRWTLPSKKSWEYKGTHCHATFPLKEIAGLSKGQLLTTIVP